jgi:superfamily II DNA/RNA helicase
MILQNEQRQTLMFSATFPPEVQEWANEWLKKDHVMVSICISKLFDANARGKENIGLDDDMAEFSGTDDW